MDTPESLARDLIRAGVEALVEAKAAVTRGGLNVKNDARRNVAQSAPVHNAHAAFAIAYDVSVSNSAIEAEIGYDKDKRGGALGNILEYGSLHNAPHRDLGRALDAEEPRFVAAIQAIGRTVL